MQAILKAVFLGFCFLLVACLPSKDKQLSADTARIVRGEVDGQTYYVPEVYFVPNSSRMSDPKEFSIYVQTLYPNFSPLLEPTADLWKRGELYKIVDVLASFNSGNKFQLASEASDISTKVSIETEKAFQIVGDEYGLIHQTQTVDGIHDLDDVWVEKKNGYIVSHITCGEKILKTDTPQCKHWTYWRNFFVKIRYDKKLLPEWQTIQQEVFGLLDSFKSEQTARNYLGQKLIEIRKKKEGIQQ